MELALENVPQIVHTNLVHESMELLILDILLVDPVEAKRPDNAHDPERSRPPSMLYLSVASQA